MTRSLVLYTRPGCHLCDEMKQLIVRVARSIPFTLEEVDISSDAALEQRYGIEIPVLMVNGRKAAKYRISEQGLVRLLESTEDTEETDQHGGTE